MSKHRIHRKPRLRLKGYKTQLCLVNAAAQLGVDTAENGRGNPVLDEEGVETTHYQYPFSTKLQKCDAAQVAQGLHVPLDTAFGGILGKGEKTFVCAQPQNNIMFAGLENPNPVDAAKMECERNNSKLQVLYFDE